VAIKNLEARWFGEGGERSSDSATAAAANVSPQN